MVSPLGLGTVKLGRNRAVKYPAAFDIPDDPAAADLLRLAQKLGVTLLDTAPAYGESEERLGRILGSCGGRDRWTIITKAGEEFDPATGESRYDFSPPAITASVERSLRRLRVNSVDCVLLHSDGRDEWILKESGAVDALARLKKKGLTRLIGISAKPEGEHAGCHGQRSESSSAVGRGGLAEDRPMPSQMRPPPIALGPPQRPSASPAVAPTCTALAAASVDVLMLTLNLSDQSSLPLIREAHARGIGVLVKKPLAGGHALNEPHAQARGADAADPLDAAFRLCLAEPGVSSVIVGTISARHLEANAAAAKRALAED